MNAYSIINFHVSLTYGRRKYETSRRVVVLKSHYRTQETSYIYLLDNLLSRKILSIWTGVLAGPKASSARDGHVGN
jgi:hypothetical protein